MNRLTALLLPLLCLVGFAPASASPVQDSTIAVREQRIPGVDPELMTILRRIQDAENALTVGDDRKAAMELSTARNVLTLYIRSQVDPGWRPPAVDPPPTDPPVTEPDPPTPPPAQMGTLLTPPYADGTWESPPDFSMLPFKDEMPPFPRYRIPTEEDCDWIVRNGKAESTRGLGTIDGEFLISGAIRTSMNAGDDLVTFGVWDNAGIAVLCDGWSLWSERSAYVKDPNDDTKFLNLKVEFVGLDDECEVSVGWGIKWGYVDYLGLYNIGVRGQSDSFIQRCNDGIGAYVMDGCWWLTAHSFGEDGKHASGVHMDDWGTLVLRRHKWRGEKPTDPGAHFREHCYYLKSSEGETWILENNIFGGNRTGFQIRPGNDTGSNDRPVGPVMIGYNFADGLDDQGRPTGYGWNHGMDGGSFDGGSCITTWSNPDSDTFVFNNRIEDAKYGCFSANGQGPARDWYNENGFPIKRLFLYGNRWENMQRNPQAPRPANLPRRKAVGITAVEEVFIWPQDVEGDFVLNGTWGMEKHGIKNGSVKLYGGPPQHDIRTYNPATQKMRSLDPAEMQALLATEPSSMETPR